MSFNITVDTLKVQTMFARVGIQYTNKKWISDITATWAANEGKLVFRTKGASIDAPWAPLDRDYLRFKQKKNLPVTENEATGQLRTAMSGGNGFWKTIQAIGIYYDRRAWNAINKRRKLFSTGRKAMKRLDLTTARFIKKFDNTL